MTGFIDKVNSEDVTNIRSDVSGVDTKVDTVITNQAQQTKLLYKSESFAATDGTIDLAEADGGDIFIEDVLIYSLTSAADLTSVSIQTNDTEPFEIMTAAEGALANLDAEKTLKTDNSQKSFYLASGKKIQYTITGAGDWSFYAVIKYRVISSGDLI